MRFLRTASKIFALVPIVVLIYDLVNEWFVEARLNIRSLKEWILWLNPDWLDPVKNLLKALFGASSAEGVMDTAAPIVLALPPIILYAIYRLWFAAKGGHGAGKVIYRSHD